MAELLSPAAVFAASFDTFKAFERLTVAQTGLSEFPAPKTIWQTLQHLIRWQSHYLRRLRQPDQTPFLPESESWLAEPQAPDQTALTEAVRQFHHQLAEIKSAMEALEWSDPHVSRHLQLIQEWALHLAFHVGEVVLLRRMQGSYPLPHQMAAFLSE